ncbi:MAG: hypothetical protein AAGG02_12530, partial [Cyanobacteria bacterium P01_H01_bin.15]
ASDMSKSAAAKKAVNSLGGLYGIGQVSKSNLGDFKREFLSLCDGYGKESNQVINGEHSNRLEAG